MGRTGGGGMTLSVEVIFVGSGEGGRQGGGVGESTLAIRLSQVLPCYVPSHNFRFTPVANT